MAIEVRVTLIEELKALEPEWDAQDLGRVGTHPELACFDTWEDVRVFVSEHEDGKDIKLMVKLVDEFGAMNIVRALRNMPDELRATHLYSTAHKMKGREEDTVELAEDFAEEIEECDPAELKLLYVSATRAKTHLDPTRVGCLDGLLDALDGGEGVKGAVDTVDAGVDLEDRF